MNIAIISGSSRAHSQSLKVSNYLKTYFRGSVQSANVDLIDLGVIRLPQWTEDIWSVGIDFDPTWREISSQLQNADAFVIVTPEWHGMVPAALKNLFLLCSNGELFHKPGLIVSVSAGLGGSYPVAELRMSSYKNSRICYLPEHLIIRNVEQMLNDFSQAQSDIDQQLRNRIHAMVGALIVYAEAFVKIRQQLADSIKHFPNGM